MLKYLIPLVLIASPVASMEYTISERTAAVIVIEDVVKPQLYKEMRRASGFSKAKVTYTAMFQFADTGYFMCGDFTATNTNGKEWSSSFVYSDKVGHTAIYMTKEQIASLPRADRELATIGSQMFETVCNGDFAYLYDDLDYSFAFEGK